jgi:RimJ/RimL family protein N-acetyltransferase
MSPLYKLKDYKETFKFEREHPKELRWDDKYKLYMLVEDKNTQGIWLKDSSELVGEIILTWQATNIVHIDKLTSLYQGKGIGHELVRLAIEWGTNSDYEFITGNARKGASWTILQNFGATEILTYKNYNNTKEDYISFKLEL